MAYPELITIIGPTASGKTRFAAELAFELNGEIISGDSRQVYRQMDIGTGKDLEDYIIQGTQIPYHLIDICPPGYKYNVFEYQQNFYQVFNDIKERGKMPVLCGGTGMYIEAVLKGYNLAAVPENKNLRNLLKDKTLDELTEILKQYKTLHNKTDIDTKKRVVRAIEIEEFNLRNPVDKQHFPRLQSLIVGLDISREERRSKISERLRQRLSGGMIEEVRRLLLSGVSPENLIYYGLEYKYVTLYLTGNIAYEEMIRSLEIAIHQFAKRQMTWFRGMEKRGFHIHWLDVHLPVRQKIDYIKQQLMIND